MTLTAQCCKLGPSYYTLATQQLNNNNSKGRKATNKSIVRKCGVVSKLLRFGYYNKIEEYIHTCRFFTLK